KAKRRVTLSICGLGWLDETEVSTVPDAEAVDVDMETGEIKSPMKNVTPPKSESPPRNNAASKGGDESKRGDYHAAIFAYLTEAHGVTAEEYPAFIAHAIGGDVRGCDINRLAEIARYAYGAARQGSKAAAERIGRIVDEWRQASGVMQPDEVPGYEQEALM